MPLRPRNGLPIAWEMELRPRNGLPTALKMELCPRNGLPITLKMELRSRNRLPITLKMELRSRNRLPIALEMKFGRPNSIFNGFETVVSLREPTLLCQKAPIPQKNGTRKRSNPHVAVGRSHRRGLRCIVDIHFVTYKLLQASLRFDPQLCTGDLSEALFIKKPQIPKNPGPYSLIKHSSGDSHRPFFF